MFLDQEHDLVQDQAITIVRESQGAVLGVTRVLIVEVGVVMAEATAEVAAEVIVEEGMAVDLGPSRYLEALLDQKIHHKVDLTRHRVVMFMDTYAENYANTKNAVF